MSFALLQTAMLVPVEQLLNTLLRMDAAGEKRLAALEGRTLAIEARSPDVNLFISVHAGRIRLSPLHEGESDATLRGRAADLLGLIRNGDRTTNLASSGIELHGSTTIAQQMQTLLQDLDPDWEYHLSRLIGDLPARGLGEGIARGSDFARRTAERTRDNVHDYLVHEKGLMLTQQAAQPFYDDILALQLRLDRLQARLAAAMAERNDTAD